MNVVCRPSCILPNNPIVIQGPDPNCCGNGGGGTIDPTALAVISLIPASVVCLTSPDPTVRAIGQNYTQTCELLVDNTPVTTTYVSATELTFVAPSSTTPTPKTSVVTVRDGATAGQGAPTFQYTAAVALTLGQLIPNNSVIGIAAHTVRALGTGFTPASIVNFDGTDQVVIGRATNYVSPTEVTFQVDPVLETVRVANVYVKDGTRQSNTLPYNFVAVALPLPVIVCPLVPATAVVGSAAIPAVQVNGSNFTATSKVWATNAAGTAVEQATTYVSPTQLTFSVNPVGQTARISQVSVRDTSGSSVITCPFEFTAVLTPPIVTEVSPPCVELTGTAKTVRVLGSLFLPTSVVNFNGVAQPTVYSSGTELRVTIQPAAMLAHQGIHQVTVDNGGAVSTPAVPLTYYATPTITSAHPDFLPTNNTALQDVTVIGTNFVPEAEAFYYAEPQALTYVSPTEVTIHRDPALVGNESGPLVIRSCLTIVSNDVTIQSNANPTLNSLAPTSTPANGTPVTVKVYCENAGTGTDATVLVDGVAVPTVMDGNIPTFQASSATAKTIQVSVRTYVGNGDADVVFAPLTLPFTFV